MTTLSRPTDQGVDTAAGVDDLDWFESIPTAECLELLRLSRLGRVGWTSSSGPVILPVSLSYRDHVLLFRTAAGSALAELTVSQPVAVLVDDLDDETRVGWSVLARGVSREVNVSSLHPDDWPHAGLRPWAPGAHDVFIRIACHSVTGRVISA